MTDKERQETLKRLKARLKCEKRQVTGNCNICKPPYTCENCPLCYEQGTLGERNIDLARAIEVLSVKAITIDWIVKWLNKNNRHYCDVDLMLEDWGKENDSK